MWDCSNTVFLSVMTYLKLSTLAAITKGFPGTQELQTHFLQLDYKVEEALKLTCPWLCFSHSKSLHTLSKLAPLNYP